MKYADDVLQNCTPATYVIKECHPTKFDFSLKDQESKPQAS